MANLLKYSGGVLTQGNLPETWTAPTSLFGTQDREDTGAGTFAATTSRWTAPASDLPDGYLFIGAFEYQDTSNGRFNPQARFAQISGTGNFVTAQAGGYSRDNSEDRSYVRAWAFYDSPSASATVDFQWKADTDDATGGTERSEIQVIPFFYADIGLYTSTSGNRPGGTTPTVVTGFTGTDGTDITIASDVVSLAADNARYLILGGQFFEGGGGQRTQRWHGLDIDGTQEDAAKAYSFYRNTANDESGDIFTWLVETVTATITVEQTCYSGDGVSALQGGADVDDSTTGLVGAHALVVIELHPDAEVFRSRDTNQSALLATTGPIDLDLNETTDFNDTASFTDLAVSSINCVQTADHLFGANVSAASNAVANTTRWTAYAEFTINGTEDADSVAGDYMRNNQGTQDTFGWSANLLGFEALTAGDDVGVSVTELAGSEGGGAGVSPAGWTGFWGINLDTLELAGGGADVTASGAPSIILPTSAGEAAQTLKATGAPSIILPTSAGESFLWPKVYLNTTETLIGATELTVTDANTAGTSITFDDAAGAPTGALFLGVENRNDSNVGWIAVTVNTAGADKTATGAPSIILPTSSGDAKQTLKAIGSPSIILLTSSGDAKQTLKGTGAPSIILPTSSGAATVTRHATGAPSIILPTSAGTAEIIKTADGSPSIILPTATGSAKQTLKATGSPSIILPTSTGTAGQTLKATGSPSIILPTSEGTATIAGAKTATGAPEIILPTSSGTAKQTLKATGAPSIILPTSAGTAAIQGAITATGSPSIILPTSSGTASQTLKSTGAPSIILPTATGAASQTLKATGSPSLPLITSAGIASVAGGGPPVAVTPTGGRSRLRGRRRYLVEIDGQWFDAENVPQVKALLAQAADLARESVDDDVIHGKNIRIKPPKIRVKSTTDKPTGVTIKRDVEITQRIIKEIYRKAREEIEQIREISRLMHKKIDEEEEEETIMLLLM